jgi:hypothetical protein
MKKKYKKREIERGWACRSERGEGRERRREEEKKKKEEEEEVKKKNQRYLRAAASQQYLCLVSSRL